MSLAALILAVFLVRIDQPVVEKITFFTPLIYLPNRKVRMIEIENVVVVLHRQNKASGLSANKSDHRSFPYMINSFVQIDLGFR